MNSLSVHDTVGEIAARRPALLRALEAAGIDYCCGGGKSLEESCREKGLDAHSFLAQLEKAAAEDPHESSAEAAEMSLTQLADHIEQTHHAYLREELPRLDMLTARVASVHCFDDARLLDVRKTLLTFAAELTSHMMKEEQVLFPMIRGLEAGDALAAAHCGSIGNPIRRMEEEHREAGDAMERMRALTDDYTPPSWACNTYRAMLEALARLERDMHLHVHKENNLLFPRAILLESERTQRTFA